MARTKYDKLLRPTDYIFRFCRYEDKKYVVRDSGYVMNLCGREIGLSEHDGKWRATDIGTGLKINKWDYKRRGDLIRNVLKHEDQMKRLIKKHPETLQNGEAELREYIDKGVMLLQGGRK